MAAGTSGGITTNGIWGYGVFDYPMVLDLLEEAGISWGVYNISWDSVPFGNTDNVFLFCDALLLPTPSRRRRRRADARRAAVRSSR
jgi:hypothetical protein